MTSRRAGRGEQSHPLGLQQAFDELRFGRDRTLNLRASFPTAAEACARAESWLRQRQVAHSGEVLIITGRGLGSPHGVGVVREAVHRLLRSLRRRGVVRDIREHTPGSFVVQLAPLKALRDAPRRSGEPRPQPRPRPPAALAGLCDETRALLAQLAELSLSSVGVRDPARFLEKEMLSQLAILTAGLRSSGDRERDLRKALVAAIEEYESS